MAGGTMGRIIEKRPPTHLLAAAAGEAQLKGAEMSDQDLELNVTDEVLGAPNVASPQMQGQINETSQGVAAADQPYLMDEIGSARWERRGLLQRLRRRPRAGGS
jgi:hypothetical protein